MSPIPRCPRPPDVAYASEARPVRLGHSGGSRCPSGRPGRPPYDRQGRKGNRQRKPPERTARQRAPLFALCAPPSRAVLARPSLRAVAPATLFASTRAAVAPRRLAGVSGQQIVRRGSTSSARYRRVMMLLASADGNRAPVIAQRVQAYEDTVRDVIHRFNEIGLACLDPRWAGGRPRLLSPDDADSVIQTATTRSPELGQPFTRWSICKLAA